MKDGDKLLQQLNQLAEKRSKLKTLRMLFLSPEYLPDYIYWMEWLKANSN